MIRFADADLDEGILSGCLRREPTMDFLSANDAKMRGLPDPEVLRIAAEDDRIDLFSFALLFAKAMSPSGPSCPKQHTWFLVYRWGQFRPSKGANSKYRNPISS